ncbi:hypothetical protein A2U01_0057916, partial [Trifolium medium]|nr:hypothetical protein [Trifolium medium]
MLDANHYPAEFCRKGFATTIATASSSQGTVPATNLQKSAFCP